VIVPVGVMRGVASLGVRRVSPDWFQAHEAQAFSREEV